MVVKGGFFPSVAIDGVGETSSEVSFENWSEGIVYGNVIGSGGGIEGSIEDCCDGVNKSKDNKSDSGVKVTNNDNKFSSHK